MQILSMVSEYHIFSLGEFQEWSMKLTVYLCTNLLHKIIDYRFRTKFNVMNRDSLLKLRCRWERGPVMIGSHPKL